jgi:hypothetical protein
VKQNLASLIEEWRGKVASEDRLWYKSPYKTFKQLLEVFDDMTRKGKDNAALPFYDKQCPTLCSIWGMQTTTCL